MNVFVVTGIDEHDMKEVYGAFSTRELRRVIK